MNFYTARTVLSCSALTAAIVIGGCADANLPPVSSNDRFQADDAPRAVDNIFARQVANGSREDGTLYPQHFTDGKLNSLGYDKLSAMAYGPTEGRLSIYLDLPKGDDYDAAQESVIKALARGGVAEKEYTLTAGPNPNVTGMAAKGMDALAAQSTKAEGKASDTDVARAMGEGMGSGLKK